MQHDSRLENDAKRSQRVTDDTLQYANHLYMKHSYNDETTETRRTTLYRMIRMQRHTTNVQH